jgi:hypothetical protein
MLIVITIIFFFLCMGIVLPFIEHDIKGTSVNPTYNEKEIINGMNSAGKSSLSIWSVIGSVASMFLWTFGSIHWLIDLLIFVPLRILLLLTISRNIWIGGGG